MEEELSVVEDCGPYRSKCGYCKATGPAEPSASHGERPKTSARWGESVAAPPRERRPPLDRAHALSLLKRGAPPSTKRPDSFT